MTIGSMRKLYVTASAISSMLHLLLPEELNDIASFWYHALPDKIEELPLGRNVIGNNAYVCIQHLLTPFLGDEKREGAVPTMPTTSISVNDVESESQ